jgi:alpha-tubulin suppressor-like RCC1 family protein
MGSFKYGRLNQWGLLGVASAAVVAACSASSTEAPPAESVASSAAAITATSCQALDITGAFTTGPGSVDGSTFFAVGLNGDVYGWGFNGNWNPSGPYEGGNPLGFDNQLQQVTSPMALGITNATKVAAHQQGACAITNPPSPGVAGTVVCVGQALGLTPVDSIGTTPVIAAVTQSTDYFDTTPLTGAVGITAGLSHACVWKGNGSVWCWGSDKSGQLGDGSNGENGDAGAPTTISKVRSSASFAVPMLKNGLPLTDVTQVVAAFDTTCILHKTGAVECVGSNATGELGLGGQPTSGAPTGKLSAVQVQPGTIFTSLYGGTAGTAGMFCGDTSAPTAATLCWGYNAFGQTDNVGPLSNDTLVTAPFQLSTDSTSTWALDPLNACEVTAAGVVECWGQNAYGQLLGGGGSVSLTEIPITGVSGAWKVAGGYGTVCALANEALWCWGSNAFGELGGNPTSTTAVSKVHLSSLIPSCAGSFGSGCGTVTNACGESTTCGGCPTDYQCSQSSPSLAGLCVEDPYECSGTGTSTQYCYDNNWAQYCSANGNASFWYVGSGSANTPLLTSTATQVGVHVQLENGGVLGSMLGGPVSSPATYGSTGCDGFIFDVDATVKPPTSSWMVLVYPTTTPTAANCTSTRVTVTTFDENGNQLDSYGPLYGNASGSCQVTISSQYLPALFPAATTNHFRIVALAEQSSTSKGSTVWNQVPVSMLATIPFQM